MHDADNQHRSVKAWKAAKRRLDGRPQQTRHELARTPFGPVSFHERVHSDLMLIRGRKREERERGKTALEWTVDP